MNKSISEILKEVSDRRKTVDRVELLKKYDSEVLRGVLFVAFANQHIHWALPEGAPPYKPSQLHDNHGQFYAEWSKLYLFLKPGFGGIEMPQVRREVAYIQLLEAVTPDDAILMINIKDGKMPYLGVTEKIVNMAFPGLIPAKVPESVNG